MYTERLQAARALLFVRCEHRVIKAFSGFPDPLESNWGSELSKLGHRILSPWSTGWTL